MRADTFRASRFLRLHGFAAGIFAVACACLLAQAALAQGLPVPANCEVDSNGANDRPGEVDVTLLCVDVGDGAPWELYSIANLDEIQLTGNNTVTVCYLFNTDADAFANLAACVTLRSSGPANDNLTALAALRLYSCSDTKADRCMGAAQIPGPYVTVCEVSHPDTDPFSPAAPNGPGDDYPYDSQVLCAIDFADFGVSPADLRLLDVSSYPSGPSSDASDTVTYTPCTTGPDCDDANPCTTDVCDPAGICMHTANPGVGCTDDLFCNGTETCNALGFCESDGVPLTCDDGVDCTIDDCDEYTDTCINDPRGSLCDDGLFCTGVESCDLVAGCLQGTPPDCADAVACTVDTCDEATDGCLHAPDDGFCADGAWCNGDESCDPEAGCMAGTAPACGDGVGCTVDACDEGTDSCSHVADDSSCSDGLFCNGAEQCNPAVGCSAGIAPDCNDGVNCTADACVEDADVCLNTPDNAACDDGQFCNGLEICDLFADCRTGVEPCIAPAVCDEGTDECVDCADDAQCDNHVFCDGPETCDNATATCLPGVAVNCDDAVPCTFDSCNEAAAACANIPADALCEDGLFCDGAEVCDPLAGCEAGAAPPCDDGISCTADSCVEATDSCAHAADGALCDDGSYCNGEEFCDPTSGCNAGEPVTCSADGYQCSIESCDETLDGCASDFSPCACGDREIVPPEECEPPATAGSFEDCNNLIDDDGDGDVDCMDPECRPDSPRGVVCDENCRIDTPCSPVGSDPSMIKFHRGDGYDSLRMHGRFPVDVLPDPITEGFGIEIANDVQPIFVASLGVGDLEGNVADARRFRFRDKNARGLGNASSRGGLESVSILFREIDGVPYIAFRVRAYGDFSAATRRLMSAQLTVGGKVGALTEEWRAARRRWYLRVSDF